ncbi:hypothetical protein ACRW6M_25480, partial [Escherichia coli]
KQVLRAYIFCGACGNNRTNRGGFQFAAARLPWFVIHMLSEQCDRLLPENNQGGGFVVTVWTRGGNQLRYPGKYRVVENLPDVSPWSEQ